MRQLASNHFEDYNNFQSTKHKIIKNYLNGWFPKLGFWSKRIIYIDTHAGQGVYKKGQYGSPLIALSTFLHHTARNKILQGGGITFVFFEENKENAIKLEQGIKELGELPEKIEYTVICQDAFDYLYKLQEDWEKEGKVLPPSFMFIDPFGFTIPCNLMRRLKNHPQSELLVNIMWRELDMSIKQEKLSRKWIEKLDSIFGCNDWVELRDIPQSVDRANRAIEIFKENIGAKWATDIKMLHGPGSIRYFLLHLTNSDDGRALIKEVFWRCCPDGDWYVRKEISNQLSFEWEQQPDYDQLEKWLKSLLKKNKLRWLDIVRESLKEIWLPKDIWKNIKKLSKEDVLDMIGGTTQKSNPEIRLKE